MFRNCGIIMRGVKLLSYIVVKQINIVVIIDDFMW